MEVILKEDVAKLGSRGDVVKVAEGFEVAIAAALGAADGITCCRESSPLKPPLATRR